MIHQPDVPMSTIVVPADAEFADHMVRILTRTTTEGIATVHMLYFWASDVEVEAAWAYWGERGDWNAALPLHIYTQRKASAMVIHAHLDREAGMQVSDAWPPVTAGEHHPIEHYNVNAIIDTNTEAGK